MQEPADLKRAQRLREALRDLCAANHDQRPPDQVPREIVEATA
jgi:hypothetical protein